MTHGTLTKQDIFTLGSVNVRYSGTGHLFHGILQLFH